MHDRIMEEAGDVRQVEMPNDPMEFLSRSWSLSAMEVSKALASGKDRKDGGGGGGGFCLGGAIPEEGIGMDLAEAAAMVGNPFSFASSATSQLVMERIMSHSQDVSPLTSGRPSHSSGPLNGGGSVTDSPPLSPSATDDVKYYYKGSNVPKVQYRGSGKTVGRWLKDRREKKKEETRAHNAQLHAAVSVAGVAAAVAAITAATAAISACGKDEQAAKTDKAMASAAILVAAQLVESAESMGVEREQLASTVHSAVNVRTSGDIITLTAAAATALRGAATLKARALKDVWNVAAVIPVERGAFGGNGHHRGKREQNLSTAAAAVARSYSDELLLPEENFLGLCSQEFLARGTELLKRTRKGYLHWKIVCVYINKIGQVMLKMKSKHVAGTITKKNKNVVVEVCRDVQAWPGRHLLEGGEQRRYFGLKTTEKRVIEFECRSQREFEIWTQGVTRLLNIVGETRNGRRD